MAHDAAYAACARLAASHYENFPVASRLVPASMRPHVAAVYAFARTADDFADEDGLAIAERYALLDEWRVRLHEIENQEPPASVSVGLPPSHERNGEARRIPGGGGQARPIECHERLAIDPALVFEALGHTIRTCRLPVSLFEDLLSAFRQDITVQRYETWESLLDYCRRSANPVGRLVLRIAGYRDDRLDAASDALCTALQLTNFWQDLAIDWRRGRLYVPLTEVAAASALAADLDANRITTAWQTALRRCASRTRDLFQAGRPVCDGVAGRLRYELRATWLGAMRVLDRLESVHFDVFTRRPALGRRDALPIAAGMVSWRRIRAGELPAPAHVIGPGT